MTNRVKSGWALLIGHSVGLVGEPDPGTRWTLGSWAARPCEDGVVGADGVDLTLLEHHQTVRLVRHRDQLGGGNGPGQVASDVEPAAAHTRLPARPAREVIGDPSGTSTRWLAS